MKTYTVESLFDIDKEENDEVVVKLSDIKPLLNDVNGFFNLLSMSGNHFTLTSQLSQWAKELWPKIQVAVDNDLAPEFQAMQVEQAKAILKEAGYIATTLWCKDDIIGRCEFNDLTLTGEEVEEVAIGLENELDANNGINWLSIDFQIQQVLDNRK